MRRVGFVGALLVSALMAAPGAARAGSADEPIDPDEVAEPRLPTVQLVQAWPKTKQALLYDPIQGTYVVVAAGQNVDGFRVSRIGKNQIVLSAVGGPARDYVLLPTPVSDLPDAPGVPGTPVAVPVATVPAAPAPPVKHDLLDPYPAGMLDPYGTEGVRVVDAPPGSKVAGAPPAPVPVPAPVPAKPTTVPATPAPSKPTPAHTPAPAPSKPPVAPAIITPAPTPATPAPSGPVVLSRKELNAALADFGTLTKDTRLTLGPTGVAFAHVAPNSLFAKVGLRDGDRVITVNGLPIHSLDDAANLYAQLGTLKQLTLDVVRGANHITLHADLR